MCPIVERPARYKIKLQYMVIVGCGRLGAQLANELSGQGHSVVVIDRNEARFANLSAEFSGFKVVGDAVELEVLRSAKVGQATCFLATTNQDNINLMLAQVAKIVFNVPLVIARIFDPSREPVYRRLGIQTISPTQLSAQAFLRAIQTIAEE
jgi:trk system potassium uptake protein